MTNPLLGIDSDARQLFAGVGSLAEEEEADDSPSGDEGLRLARELIERDERDVDTVDEAIEEGELALDEVPLDTTVHSESLDARIMINGTPWYIIEYMSEREIDDIANFGQAIIYPRNDLDETPVPQYADDLEAEVKIILPEESETIPERNEIYNEWFTLFKGYVNNFRHMGDGRWHVAFSDFSSAIAYEHTTIHADANENYIDEIVEQVLDNLEGSTGTGEPNGVSIDDVVQQPIETPADRQEHADKIDTELSKTEKRDAISYYGEQNATSVPIKYSKHNKKAAEILDDLATMADARWWVDKENVVHFGKFKEDKISERQLDFVIEADDGKLTPPYQSVAVIGDGIIADPDGDWGKEYIESKTHPVVAIAIGVPEEFEKLQEEAEDILEQIDTLQEGDDELTEDEEATLERLEAELEEVEEEIDEMTAGEVGENEDIPPLIPNKIKQPVFVYKNKDIKTPDHAKQVAINLAEELAEQLEGGEIEVVGRPDLRLYDVAIMPERLSPSDESHEYIIGGIRDVIDNNGYTTTIKTFKPLNVGNGMTQVRDALEVQTADEDDTVGEEFEGIDDGDISGAFRRERETQAEYYDEEENKLRSSGGTPGGPGP